VGCGSGQEAGILASRLGAQVVGVDVTDSRFDPQAAHPAILRMMDAEQLDLADDSFDFVYSFHALEHIPNKYRALAEMRRVLRPGGGYLIGTPNKTRLVGYINSSVPIGTRVRWNLNDYRFRLSGRWANEKGAHAGFSGPELVSLCQTAFGTSEDISDEYYGLCYPGKARVLSVLRQTRLYRIVYPCVYVTGAL
jgi:SAM-dependent methyltransferase